jgi:hypothetical protein
VPSVRASVAQLGAESSIGHRRCHGARDRARVGTGGDRTFPIEEALLNLATQEPDLGEVVVEQMIENRQAAPDRSEPAPDAPGTVEAPAAASEDRGLLDGVTGLLGGRGGDR